MAGPRARSTIAVMIVVGATALGGVGYAITRQDVDATVSAVTIPQTRYTSSGDELIPIPGDPGSYWIAERLYIIIEQDVGDPAATIAEIAQLHGGIVIETYADLGIYRVRFPGYDLAALQDLGEVIEARSDVSTAARDIEGPGARLFS